MMITINTGFTELSVRYNVDGKGGPSKLTQMLNSYMGAMIQEVLAHHGDILKFSGDAFFCMWKTHEKYPLSEIVHDAMDCAIFIQRRCGTYLTDVGVTLKVKISIAAGPVIFSIIGNEQFSHYVVVGTPIVDVKEAQYHTSSGEILVSQSAWNYASISEYLITDLHDGKHYKVTGFTSKWKSSARRRHQQEVISTSEDKVFSLISTNDISKSSESLITSNETKRLSFSLSQIYNDEIEGCTLRPTVDVAVKKNLRGKLRRFIIPPLMHSLELNEPIEFLTEVRQVVILFVNIIIKEDVLEKFVDVIKDSFEIVFRIVDEMKGCVNKISLFDKDYMILCIFGLRGMKSNVESQIALHCGHDIRQSLIELPEIQTVSCAITTGLTYCGVVGHSLRREYTVVSLTVNKAARLMIAYPDKVICDRETFLNSKLEAKFFILQKTIKLKGISKAEPIYEYREQLISSTIKNRVNLYPLLDRELEINIYLDLLNNFVTSQTFKNTHSPDTVNASIGLIIRGESKQGKSCLFYEMINVTPGSIPVHNLCLHYKDYQVPYTTIRNIFGLALSLKYSELDRNEREMKLFQHLNKINMTELYCALNDVFDVRFEYSDVYKSLTQSERHRIKRKLFEHLVQSYFPSLWVLGIDHAEFIDDKSWILLYYLFKLERCFTILTIGQFKPISENGLKVIERLKMQQITLQPLSKWYHAALACQILNVRAIPVELEWIIQTRSNGNPGWIKNYLITLNQMKAILIQSVPKMNIANLGLVSPPSAMLIRNHSPLKSKGDISNQSINIKHDDIWNLLKQCIVDSDTDVPKTTSAHSFETIEQSDIPICRLASHFKVKDFNSEYNSMNALIMKTFDSLSSYEQHLIKCSSILGERFLRSMLLYVMLVPATPFQTACAVKHLFDIKVLTCARGKFDKSLRLILESNINDDLNEDTEELCQCLGLKYHDTCKYLPQYAECGYMKFESHTFQETIYSLLTDHQKKEVHGRAIRYLESNSNRCKICGQGFFHRFDGISRYQLDQWNRSELMSHLDEILHGETMSIASFEGSDPRSYDGIKSSFLIYDPMLFENIPKSSTVDIVRVYNMENKKKYRCFRSNRKNLQEFNISKLPKFAIKNLSKCQCNSILNWTYTQFIMHLRGAGRYDKLLKCQLDYAHFCIYNSNIPLAFKLLDDAKTVLDTQTVYDKDNTFATWLIPIHNGRIHMLTGCAKLHLQEFNAALESLHTAMIYFGHPFPKTKIGIKYALKKQQYRQKLLLQFPQRFIHKKTGKYGEFCEILSDCLGYFYELHKKMSAWNLAKLAGIWCLNEALSASLNFHTECKAYAIMIEISAYFDKPVHLLEILALKLCLKRQFIIETSEFHFIIMLYNSMLINRFVKGNTCDAQEIGYIILNLARKLRNFRAIKEILQHLSDIAFFLNKPTEILQYINEMYFNSTEYCDVTQRVAYFANCIQFTLNTGYAIIDFSRCEQFYKLEYGSFDLIYSSESEKRFFINMWLWYVRHFNWNGAQLYHPQIFGKKIKCRSLRDHWLALEYLEGLIITLVYYADMHFVETVRELKQHINKLLKYMDTISKRNCFIRPRYYHLKVYYLKANYANPKVDKLLRIAKETASKFNNFYEPGFIKHNELYWEGKLTPELVHQWKTSSLSIGDWRTVLEDPSNTIYYTFVLPCKPICS